LELWGAIFVAAIVAFGILVIVKGWRFGSHRDDPNFIGTQKRGRITSLGNAFADAAIVLTVFSFDLPVVFVGSEVTLLGRLLVGCALLLAMRLLPSLVRPLVALLAGVSVMLSADGALVWLLAPVFLLAALAMAVVRR